MTIRNFTFFSPTGTEFPVSSNADAKLYLMLSGMGLDTFKRKDWETPVDTALNRQYSNTSLVVGGRYFELEDETVALQSSTDNYIHANIDLTTPNTPVSISVETTDNSNAIDINNNTGVLKQCFDIVTTNGMGVTSQRVPKQKTSLGAVEVETLTVKQTNSWEEISKSGAFNGSAPQAKFVSDELATIRALNLTNQNQLPAGAPVTIASTTKFKPNLTQEFVILIRASGFIHARLLVNATGTIQIVPGSTIPANTGFSFTVVYPTK